MGRMTGGMCPTGLISYPVNPEKSCQSCPFIPGLYGLRCLLYDRIFYNPS
jgi:hypothetical protein